MGNKIQKNRIKEPVKIRYKQLAGGTLSIYLDTYYNGKREYEFLRLYLLPNGAANAKELNKATIRAANAIKAKRVISVLNGRAGLRSTNNMENMTISNYVLYHIKKSSQTHRGNSYANGCRNMSNHLLKYLGRKFRQLRMKDIDLDVCKGFAEYLKQAKSCFGKPLSAVTAYHYFVFFKNLLNEAFVNQVISCNPISKMKKSDFPQRPIVAKDFLDADEVIRLANTPCKNEQVKRSFMFSCFTGLRWGDICQLQWRDIKESGGIYRFSIVMQKTQEPITNKLNAEAIQWLPPRQENPNQPVFPMPCLSCVENVIAHWVAKAQIAKHVTFHTARHSYATMVLTAGVDIYTISKLLGHRNVRTTTLYASVVDKTRDNAMDSLSQLYQAHLSQCQMSSSTSM